MLTKKSKNVFVLQVCLFVFSLFSSFVFSQEPDLIIQEINASGIAGNWDTLQIHGIIKATVRNHSLIDITTPFHVKFFEDFNSNGIWDETIDHTFGDVQQSSLNANQSAVVEIIVDDSILFRDNLIYALADCNDVISESNEENNYYNSGINCQTGGVITPFVPELEWAWTSTEVYPDSLNACMTPAVMDITGDGIPDVIFATTNNITGSNIQSGILRVLNGSNGMEIFSITESQYRVNITSSVAVGDIDLDSIPEIIACESGSYRLIAFEHDGSFKWKSQSLEYIEMGAPSIADLDHDGIPEIIIGRQVLNNDGSIRWTGNRGKGGIYGPLSLVADVNMDRSPEIVAGNTLYSASGSTLFYNTQLPDGFNAIANFDSDPNAEIILVSNNSIWLLEDNMTIKWGPIAIPSGGGGPPTIADYDGDGMVEIGVAGYGYYVVYETDGSEKWKSVTQDYSSKMTGSSVFDFEGDGSAEVVYRDETTLRVYRGSDGTILFETPVSSCTWYESVIVVDVDADGNAEILAVANNNCSKGPEQGVYVYGDKNDNWVATRQIWNQHTYHITNVNDDGTIPIVEQNNWEVYNNYRQNILTSGNETDSPDLTASYIRLTREPNEIQLTVRVGNGGALLAKAGVKVAIYDGDPECCADIVAVAVTSIDLHPGEYEDINFTMSSTAITSNTVFALADSGRNHRECNEINNKYGIDTQCPQYDLNHDCVINLLDFCLLAGEWLNVGPIELP